MIRPSVIHSVMAQTKIQAKLVGDSPLGVLLAESSSSQRLGFSGAPGVRQKIGLYAVRLATSGGNG